MMRQTVRRRSGIPEQAAFKLGQEVCLMARLGGALNLREVAFAKLAPEQIKRHCVNCPCGGGIVSSAFVPHECMRAVEFMPAEICSSVGNALVNRCPAVAGNV